MGAAALPIFVPELMNGGRRTCACFSRTRRRCPRPPQIKQRLRSRDSYNDLLKTLNMYASDIISKPELLSLAKVRARMPACHTQHARMPPTLTGDKLAWPAVVAAAHGPTC